MISTSYCRYMARYNRWMNEKLYSCAAKLDDDMRRRNMGAFFKSIHGTFNHLLVGDRLWLSRFDGEPHGVISLDEELYHDFDELTLQRKHTDDRADRMVTALTPARISSTITFRRLSGNKDEVEIAMDLCLMQFFNHQTHHRGQVTALLMQCGINPGVTDLPWMPKDFASPVFTI